MSVPLAMAIADPGAGARHAHVGELFDGVDDLIKRVADVDNPEIRRVRAKVHAALVVAKNAFADRKRQIRERSVVEGVVEGVREDDDLPVEELGVALLIGLGLGLVGSLRHIDAG